MAFASFTSESEAIMANHFSRFIGLLGMGLIASTAGAAGCGGHQENCLQNGECLKGGGGSSGSTSSTTTGSSAATGTSGGSTVTASSSTASTGGTGGGAGGSMPNPCGTAIIVGDSYEWFTLGMGLNVVAQSPAMPGGVNETGTTSIMLEGGPVAVQIALPSTVAFTLPDGCLLVGQGRGLATPNRLDEAALMSLLTDTAGWQDLGGFDGDPSPEGFSGAPGYSAPFNWGTVLLFGAGD